MTSPARLLWVGRLLNWKRPQLALRVAERLRRSGFEFRLEVIGSGPLEDMMRDEIRGRGLTEHVQMAGPMPYELVREKLSASDVFLLTSTRQEGWGAVLNEAMSAGCASVANVSAGSVPYLVAAGRNGLTYPSSREGDLLRLVDSLVQDPQRCRLLGEAAIETTNTEWSPATAASRLIASAELVLQDRFPRYDSGPCSPA